MSARSLSMTLEAPAEKQLRSPLFRDCPREFEWVNVMRRVVCCL
jgi:hypothetical protein